jgi:hypothetical protein
MRKDGVDMYSPKLGWRKQPDCAGLLRSGTYNKSCVSQDESRREMNDANKPCLEDR